MPQLNSEFTTFLTQTYEQHQTRFDLSKANNTLGLATILYHILHNSVVPFEYQFSFYSVDSIAFVNFIVRCKIYLERIRNNINSLPLLATYSDEELHCILNDLLTRSATDLKFKNSSEININRQDPKHNYCATTFGREIITQFMEKVQIKTPKCGAKSFAETINSALLIKTILSSLNNDITTTSSPGITVDMICTSPPFYNKEQDDPENLNKTQSRKEYTC